MAIIAIFTFTDPSSVAVDFVSGSKPRPVALACGPGIYDVLGYSDHIEPSGPSVRARPKRLTLSQRGDRIETGRTRGWHDAREQRDAKEHAGSERKRAGVVRAHAVQP